MKTAALLQLPGNPFALSYWLRNYERVWKGEIDELHVFLNGARNREALLACEAMVRSAGARWVPPNPNRLTHGYATQVLFDQCDADTIMLIEDDAFVRTPGAIAAHLEWANYECVVGSPRGGMSPTLEQPARDRWGADPVGPDGSYGYGLWPCFLFAPRSALAQVWRGFPAQTWPVGSTIPGLDYYCAEEMHTDTFTASAFMLRDALPITVEGQWKELWMHDLPEMQALAGYDPPWFHAGGLSNEDFFNGGGALDNARPNIGGTNEGKDWAHRIWWIRHIVLSAPRDLLPDLRAHYLRRLDDLTREMGVGQEVDEWGKTEPPWINWDDEG